MTSLEARLLRSLFGQDYAEPVTKLHRAMMHDHAGFHEKYRTFKVGNSPRVGIPAHGLVR